jgi:hypothetical protein
MSSPEVKVQQLASAFPTLLGADGINPWDPNGLDAWACGPAPGHGARHAARFVLAVWNNDAEWECGRFDVVEALSVWGDGQRSVFLAWVLAPWWA